jgi:hypothetical protein
MEGSLINVDMDLDRIGIAGCRKEGKNTSVRFSFMKVKV